MKTPILLLAYQCGPGLGSVSHIGWEWFVRLSKTHDVTLVTHIRNRQAIEQEDSAPQSKIIYIDSEWFAGPLYRMAKKLFPNSEHSVFLLSSLDYFLFDLLSFRHLRKALKAGANWQLIHRVTPVTSAAPTTLGYLGLPILLGPLNCGLNNPVGFEHVLQEESLWLTPLRQVGNFLDFLFGSSRHITRFLAANHTTKNSIRKAHRARCHILSENSVNTDIFRACAWPPAPSSRHPLRVLFVGRLIALKGLDMLLQAVACLTRQGYSLQLEVIGDGPMRSDWQALASRLHMDEYCHFRGQQTAQNVAYAMQTCHVFCLPSVRESGGAVLLEAMACARPVIALNFGGPAEVVNDDTGALLDLESPRQVVQDIAIALADVIANPASWAIRGKRGLHMIEAHYSWPAKLAAVATHYEELLSAPTHVMGRQHV